MIVPPREGAVFNEEEELWQKARNDAICQIIGLGNDEEAIKLTRVLDKKYSENGKYRTADFVFFFRS